MVVEWFGSGMECLWSGLGCGLEWFECDRNGLDVIKLVWMWFGMVWNGLDVV